MTFVRLCDEVLLFFVVFQYEKLFFSKNLLILFSRTKQHKKKRWNKLSDNFLIRSLSGKFYKFNPINLKMIMILIFCCVIFRHCAGSGVVYVCVCASMSFCLPCIWARAGLKVEVFSRDQSCNGLVLFNAFCHSFGMKTKLREPNPSLSVMMIIIIFKLRLIDNAPAYTHTNTHKSI
jgi:hypothetical protein